MKLYYSIIKKINPWKVTIGVFCWILFLFKTMFIIIEGRSNKKWFFTHYITSKVIDSISFYGRSIEYKLEVGGCVYLSKTHKNKISVGDSISKGKNTYTYDVYRKNNKQYYEWIGTYDFNNIN